MFHQNFGGGFGNDDMGPGRYGFLDFLFWKLFLFFILVKYFSKFWNSKIFILTWIHETLMRFMKSHLGKPCPG